MSTQKLVRSNATNALGEIVEMDICFLVVDAHLILNRITTKQFIHRAATSLLPPIQDIPQRIS